jgi:hypothetical protein
VDLDANFYTLTGGAQELLHLDLLSHKALISETYFQSKVLVEGAETLATRLCDTLSPIMLPDETLGGQTSQPLPSTNQHEHILGTMSRNSARDYFIQPFLWALQLKAQLLLSTNKYRLVFFHPGTKFHPGTMIRDFDADEHFIPKMKVRKSHQKPGQGVEPETAVKLCLFPALYSIPVQRQDQEQSVGVRIEHCVVDYDNFIRDDNEGLDGILMSRAIVLV